MCWLPHCPLAICPRFDLVLKLTFRPSHSHHGLEVSSHPINLRWEGKGVRGVNYLFCETFFKLFLVYWFWDYFHLYTNKSLFWIEFYHEIKDTGKICMLEKNKHFFLKRTSVSHHMLVYSYLRNVHIPAISHLFHYLPLCLI
jgi:hypothetical protein